MGVDAVAALAFGRLYDRFGLPVLAFGALSTALSAPLVFLGGFNWAVAGVVLWGAGMGAQESIVRAAIAAMIPADRRAPAYGLFHTIYGLFHTIYGLFWFLGSAARGALYGISIESVAALGVILQLVSIPLLLLTRRLLPGRI